MRRKAGLARMFVGLAGLGLIGSVATGILTGCAVAPTAATACDLKSAVLPALANADHAAAAPGNQVAFNVGWVDTPTTCGVPNIVPSPQSVTWVSSDPVNAPISNVAATAGIATCIGATTVPVTISTSPAGSVEVAMLTCK